MADDLKNLAITITVEGSQQAKAALEKIEDAFRDTSKAAGNADSNIKKASEGLTAFGAFAANIAANAVSFLARELTQLGLSIGKDLLDEAAGGELVFKELSAAVERAGLNVEETVSQLDAFAQSMANVTRFTDDEIKSAQALALSLGMSTDEIEKYFSVAADLAVAKGGTLKDAILGLNKSLAGQAGPLQRLLPELKDFTEEQLKAGAAIDYVRKAFGGAAGAEINTYAGSVMQLKKAWQDILEIVGTPVIQALKPALQGIVQYLQELMAGDSLTNFGQSIADALTEVGAYLLNFWWFLEGKDSYFGKLDAEMPLSKRLLEGLTQGLEEVLKFITDWITKPEVVDAFLRIGGAISAALIKGMAVGISQGLMNITDQLGITNPQDNVGAKAHEFLQTLPKGDPTIFKSGVFQKTAPQTNQNNIQQDVKIYTNGESGEALQRQLRSTIAQFKTNVMA